MGYFKSGFEVTGVDINTQPNYPFNFIQSDAIEYVLKHGSEYDVIAASPPCQSSSALTKGTNKDKFEYPDLIPATREALANFSVPTIIENVKGAEIRKDVLLCGEMFGLKVIRHRFFEINNIKIESPKHIKHRGRVIGYRHGVLTTEADGGYYYAPYGLGGYKGTVRQWQDAMGIYWTNVRKELAEAIPPLYTNYLGQQIIKQL